MGKSKAKTYTSKIIDTIVNDPKNNSYNSVKSKMLLAVRIKEKMRKLGISNSDLAEKLGKNKSVITKWLSGIHNFTHDTLFEIQEVLEIRIINVRDEDELVKIEFKISFDVMAGEKRTTSSPLIPKDIINDIPVTQGLC